jgi:hypothetical protein
MPPNAKSGSISTCRIERFHAAARRFDFLRAN